MSLETLARASGLDRTLCLLGSYIRGGSGWWLRQRRNEDVLVLVSHTHPRPPSKQIERVSNGEPRCCLHVRHGIAPRSLRLHPTKRGVHRGVLRHERQQPAGGEHRGGHVQVQRDQLHAAVRAGPGGAAGRGRHGRQRGGRGAQRRPLRARRQPGRRRVVGEEQHPGVPQGVLPVRVRRQRGGRRCHPEPAPGHAERAGRAGVRRAGPHQGDHVGVAGDPRRVLPALRRRLHRRGGRVHGPRGAVPGPHRRAADGQHLPVPGVGLQPERHGHELRALHRLRHRGPGRRLRVPEPVRHHGGRLLHGDGQARRRRRQARRVRERLAVGRRPGGDAGQRQDLQPVPHQPRRPRHAEAPRRHRDLRVRHVQREPEGQRRGAELGALLPKHAARLPHQLLIERSIRGLVAGHRMSVRRAYTRIRACTRTYVHIMYLYSTVQGLGLGATAGIV